MWYGVSLLFESVHTPEIDKEAVVWEMSVVLVKARDKSVANDEGERIGKEQEHEYTSATGDLVRWTFRQVESVYEINADTVQSGTEVFSRFLRASDVRSLLTPFDD